MTTLYKYRIYCKSEKEYNYVWSEDEPIKCPNGNHQIDSSKTVIIEQIKSNLVKIQEENTPTNGNFTTESVSFNIPANSTAFEDSSWKYPISVYAVSFISKVDQEGDIVSISANPDKTLGVITENLVADLSTTFKVSSTVLENIQPGFGVRLSDGVNYDDLGEVYNVDKDNGTISVDKAPAHDYSLSTPTYVLMESYFVKNYEIGPSWKYDIGMSKIGAAYIPANTVIRTYYKNNSNTIKRFVGYIEYTH